jgi:hypothetical protein
VSAIHWSILSGCSQSILSAIRPVCTHVGGCPYPRVSPNFTQAHPMSPNPGVPGKPAVGLLGWKPGLGSLGWKPPFVWRAEAVFGQQPVARSQQLTYMPLSSAEGP